MLDSEGSGETLNTDIILLKYLKTHLAIALAHHQMVATLQVILSHFEYTYVLYMYMYVLLKWT